MKKRSMANTAACSTGVEYIWIGNISRDQYMGAFFGLSVAYEHMPEDRALIREITTPLIDRLLEKNWSVVMPDGSSSTVFLAAPRPATRDPASWPSDQSRALPLRIRKPAQQRTRHRTAHSARRL
jgi:hypothetical protein